MMNLKDTMNNSSNNTRRFLSYLPSRLFFLFMFLYLAIFADYVFYYQEKTSLFIFSGDFLMENLHQPGGLLIYLGKFLSTFYYYPVAGALIASLVIWLIVITASGIIRELHGTRSRLIPVLAGIALFYLQTEYQYLLYNNLGILLQLLIFFLVIKYLKGWLPVILSPLLYFATGGFTWIFLIMYSLWLILSNQGKWWIRIISLWLLNFIVIYLTRELLFFQSTEALLLYPYSNAGTGSQGYLFIPVVAVLTLLPVVSGIRISNQLKRKFSENILLLSGAFAVIVVMVTISILSYDWKTRQYFIVEKLFYEERYQEVIDYNIKHPSRNSQTIYLNNIALCETGKLNDLLFHFPQNPDGSTLFLKWEMISEVLKHGAYFYYTAGMINEAHRWAYENMVMKGLSPEGLKMLIKTEIINGNYKSASKYTSILKKTLYYRDEAIRFEKLLYDDKAIDADQELGSKRRNKITVDFFTITDNPYINVERVIATNPLNQKALEYKLAFLLLNKAYKSIGELWGSLDRYSPDRIPTHMKEAIVMIKSLNPAYLPPTGNLVTDANTEAAFNRFLQVLQAYGANPKTAEPKLRKQFGNTFWYWAFYR